jgi:hypothetical protein
VDVLRFQGRKDFKPLRKPPFDFGSVRRLEEPLAGVRLFGDRLPTGFLLLLVETTALPRLVFEVVLVCLGAMHASFPLLQSGFGHYSTRGLKIRFQEIRLFENLRSELPFLGV